MSFKVAFSSYKQDGSKGFQETERKVFFSEMPSKVDISRKEMFAFFRQRPEMREGAGDRNFEFIKDFFHQPPVKIGNSSLAYKTLNSRDIAVIEVRGNGVSTWNGEWGEWGKSTSYLENTQKKVKRSYFGSYQKTGDSVYKIFPVSAQTTWGRDRMLQAFMRSDFTAVRTYSESYMGLETVYSVVSEEAIAYECKGESRFRAKAGDPLRGQYQDPFNGFFGVLKEDAIF